jgi:hypothetical protein
VAARLLAASWRANGAGRPSATVNTAHPRRLNNRRDHEPRPVRAPLVGDPLGLPPPPPPEDSSVSELRARPGPSPARMIDCSHPLGALVIGQAANEPRSHTFESVPVLSPIVVVVVVVADCAAGRA